MSLEVAGRLHTKFDAQQVTERFRKREFVIELADSPRYPQLVLFQLTGDRCEMLEDVQEGEELRVEFSLRGREWTSPKGEVRYFNSLEVWSIDRGSGPRDDEPPPPTDEDIPF